MILVVSTGKTGVVKMSKKNTSSFPFVYVTISIDNLFRLMCQLLYLSRVTKYFQNKWLKYFP